MSEIRWGVFRRAIVPFVLGAVFSAVIFFMISSGKLSARGSADLGGSAESARVELPPAPNLTAIRPTDKKMGGAGTEETNKEEPKKAPVYAHSAAKWKASYAIVRKGWILSILRMRELEKEIAVLNGEEERKEEEPLSPEEEALLAEREELVSAPTIEMKFNRVRQGDMLRMLFEESGVDFVMPETTNMENLLTLEWEDASPFGGLEVIARNSGYFLAKENGIWTLEPIVEPGMESGAGYVESYEKTVGRKATEEEFDSLTGFGLYPVNGAGH